MEKYLIVGLGNPGAEYHETRHNAGWMVVDAFAKEQDVTFDDRRYGYVSETSIKGKKLFLLKPTTYMNLSGNAVRYWVNKLEIPLENLIVICDDLNLPFGTLRMRKSGSDGGHNGLKDIQARLESTSWARIRVGIGNDFARGQQVDYVIGELSDEEMQAMPQICKRVIEGCRNFATIGPDRAINFLNVKPKKEETPESGI